MSEEVKQDNPWLLAGYAPELANLCKDLEDADETSFLPEEVEKAITVTSSAVKVEDFDELTDLELLSMTEVIRNQLPRIERDTRNFTNQITSARAVEVEIDFI